MEKTDKEQAILRVLHRRITAIEKIIHSEKMAKIDPGYVEWCKGQRYGIWCAIDLLNSPLENITIELEEDEHHLR